MSRLAAPILNAVRRAVGRSAAAVAQSAITCMRAISLVSQLYGLYGLCLAFAAPVRFVLKRLADDCKHWSKSKL